MLVLTVVGAGIAAKDNEPEQQLQRIIGCMLIAFSSFILGSIVVGYDFTQECWAKSRSAQQTKLHGLARTMLDQCISHDTRFFVDSIVDTEEYIKYQSLNTDEPIGIE